MYMYIYKIQIKKIFRLDVGRSASQDQFWCIWLHILSVESREFRGRIL